MVSAKKCLNDLLVEVFNYILSLEGTALKRWGVRLSMNEVHIIEAIEKSKEPTMSNVARKLMITVGTLTTAINRLVEKKYVIRYGEPEDRRKVLLRLTNEAEKVLHIHKEFHNDMIDNVIKDMNIKDDDVLIKSLDKVSKYFKKKYEEQQ